MPWFPTIFLNIASPLQLPHDRAVILLLEVSPETKVKVSTHRVSSKSYEIESDGIAGITDVTG